METTFAAKLSTRSSSLPYLGKSPSISKSTAMPFSSRIGFTLAYLIADKESATTDKPAIPVANQRVTLRSCNAILVFISIFIVHVVNMFKAFTYTPANHSIMSSNFSHTSSKSKYSDVIGRYLGPICFLSFRQRRR